MNHLIISFSIIGGCICAASSHHLWAYSWKDSPFFFSNSHKDCAVGSYLGVEPVVFQERVGHFPQAKGFFPILHTMWPRGHSNYQEKSGKAEGAYPHREPSLYRTCTSTRKGPSTIILDKLGCIELGRHNDLRKVGQTI